ncbi:hypothetical protein R1flu_010556 [Riccia fluitans]|uniref:protein-serine/threonine phosphatase n=1 Tax=Riccia fluitans TaxID=41844 RepID=A0ABD1Z6E3_9MARC
MNNTDDEQDICSLGLDEVPPGGGCSEVLLSPSSSSSNLDVSNGEEMKAGRERLMSPTRVGPDEPVVPQQSLVSLMNRELQQSSSKLEKPSLLYGQAGQSKRGEDYVFIKTDVERHLVDGVSTFDVFAIFDGHNGRAAAIYSRENVLKDVLSAIPPGLTRSQWSDYLPVALVAGFVKTDKEFQSQEQSSGTTATFVVIDGYTITVASVGDSRCVLEYQGTLTTLTVDHRLEVDEDERNRIQACGGEVGRLSTVGGAEIGPLRCWPGGLCLSRSIGDMDVGEFIVPIPYVKQIKIGALGGRLIVASDGVWDALSTEKTAKCCRGLPAELAAKAVVKEALRTRGLRDDTTCLIVDIISPSRPQPEMMVKQKSSRNLLKFFQKHSKSSKKLASGLGAGEPASVQMIFEEGSAMLADRLGSLESSLRKNGENLQCAVCQAVITSGEGISVHAGKRSHGPFLCPGCKQKQDAMEGRRLSRDLADNGHWSSSIMYISWFAGSRR